MNTTFLILALLFLLLKMPLLAIIFVVLAFTTGNSNRRS